MCRKRYEYFGLIYLTNNILGRLQAMLNIFCVKVCLKITCDLHESTINLPKMVFHFFTITPITQLLFKHP